MDNVVEYATLGTSGVLLIISLVFTLFFLFVSGSWSLHSQKNKAMALAMLVVIASSVVQLVMSLL